ncbi:hypothetical protein HPB51_008611 [Rhipicephalus microplus]|uniref:Uncharacterized protein n=1 Tax=Rhipicephalus microplus TaxID=6941 RepID=A0A9J6EP26_RHIMP|nr:hypothetical protein HPB51_008611 [Rhipicephalus microplus]
MLAGTQSTWGCPPVHIMGLGDGPRAADMADFQDFTKERWKKVFRGGDKTVEEACGVFGGRKWPLKGVESGRRASDIPTLLSPGEPHLNFRHGRGCDGSAKYGHQQPPSFEERSVLLLVRIAKIVRQSLCV